MERVNLEKVYSTFSEFSSVPFKYSGIKEKSSGCSQRGLNSRPLDYETNALPTAPWKPAYNFYRPI